MCTRLGFPLVPVPTYLPNMYKLEHSNIRKIDGTASAEVRRVENEMMVIMEEYQEKDQQNIAHNSFHSSFSRIRSEELNDMGYGLSKISPITFNGDTFQPQVIGHRIMHQCCHLGNEEMKLIQNHFDLDRYHNRVKILSLIMQSYL